jgi:hypothetical protein
MGGEEAGKRGVGETDGMGRSIRTVWALPNASSTTFVSRIRCVRCCASAASCAVPPPAAAAAAAAKTYRMMSLDASVLPAPLSPLITTACTQLRHSLPL